MANIYRNSVHSVNKISVDLLCDPLEMGESNERLRSAREKAGFKSARAAALRYGWTVSTYASHENGQTPVPQKAAETYAPKFRTTAAWILTGEGSLAAKNIARVMGMIGAGGEITPEYEQVPADGLSEIEAPFPLPDDAIAFQVEGNSMWPRYDDGDVVICRNRERDPIDLIGFEAAVRTAKGRRYLKRVLSGKSRGVYDLESHNAEPIRGVKIVWASEVHSVIRAGQWSKLDAAGKKRVLKRRSQAAE
jgi:phage repressor protein C with HTH and peptisase S24 domain